jgi:hypothetical protein
MAFGDPGLWCRNSSRQINPKYYWGREIPLIMKAFEIFYCALNITFQKLIWEIFFCSECRIKAIWNLGE